MEARLRAFAAVARQRVVLARRAGAVCQPAGRVEARRVSRGWSSACSWWCVGGGGATLTPAGELLADYVLRAEALLANAGRALAAGEGREHRGRSRSRRRGSPARTCSQSCSAGSQRRHPGVVVDFRRSTSGRCTRARPSTDAELALVGGFVGPARAGERAARRRRGRAHRPARPRRAPPARPGELGGPDVDLARGGLGDARCRRGSALGDRATSRCGRSRCPPGRP